MRDINPFQQIQFIPKNPHKDSLFIYQKYVKRLFDVLFESILIVLLIIPLVMIAIFIKLDSKGPILFKQKRIGKDLKPFIIYKFRTMTTVAPNNCPTNDLKNAGAYKTRVGRYMRRLSIDEIPQLFNVLRNEMSIVGPRPVIPLETDLILERAKYNANACKPGITGWAQVNGRNKLRVTEKAKMDGEYANKLGVVIDIKCLYMTIWTILSDKGQKVNLEQTQPDYIEPHQQTIQQAYSN